jgi:branched-chain amino acid transport system substrate-binding protein
MGRKPIRRRNYLEVVGAGIAAGLAGCAGNGDGGGDGDSGGSDNTTTGSAGNSPETVEIGAIYPLSGGSSSAGKTIEQLIRNAVTVVNEDHSELDPLVLASGEGLPNLGGAQVELTVADHRTDPAQGRAEAERLIDQGVDMLLGSFNSSVTKTVSQAAEQAGIPHVTNISSSPDLTKRGFKWFFRSAPTNNTSVRNQYELLTDINESDEYDADINSVAVIHEDTEFGAVVARLQEELAGEFGFELALDPIAYTAESVSSLQSQVQRIRNADPDVVFPTSYLRDAILLMEDMQTLGYSPELICAVGAGFGQEDFRKNPVSTYTCHTSAWSDDLTEEVPELKTYSDFVEEQTGIQFSFIWANAWGGVPTMLKAVDNAGSTEPDAIRQALVNQEIESPAPTGMPHGVRYDENHDNELASNVIVQYTPESPGMAWSQQGIVEDHFVYPFPPWDER